MPEVQKQRNIELVKIYPFNLANDIFGDEVKAIDISPKKLIETLLTLTEREQAVLRLRYREELTLEKTGNHIGVTKERIRQIQAKAVRKLRHPSRVKQFTAIPYDEHMELQDKYFTLIKEYGLLKRAYEEIIKTKAINSSIQEVAEYAAIMAMEIHEMGLTTRPYNCLIRHGIKTMKDLSEMTEEELMKVRNLGRKSFFEVKDAMEKYGVKLKGDSND